MVLAGLVFWLQRSESRDDTRMAEGFTCPSLQMAHDGGGFSCFGGESRTHLGLANSGRWGLEVPARSVWPEPASLTPKPVRCRPRDTNPLERRAAERQIPPFGELADEVITS